MYKVVFKGTQILFWSATAAIALHASQGKTQVFSGSDVTNGPFSSGLQTFRDNSRFDANTPDAAKGGDQSFYDQTQLNASVQGALSGGDQKFWGNSQLNASATRAITAGSQLFFDNSVLNATAAGAISSSGQTFYGTSTLNAQVADAISDGMQEFRGDSTLNASVSRAINGGLQKFFANSRLSASAAGAINDGGQNFLDNSLLQASAAHAVSGGSQHFFGNSVLNASVSNAVSGGSLLFNDSSTLNATAADAVTTSNVSLDGNSVLHATAANAISGAQLLLQGSSTLNAAAADILSKGLHTFRDNSTVNATSANAVSGGQQRFVGNSVIHASAGQAISGGQQLLQGHSVLNVSAAQGLSGGTQILSNDSAINVLADDALGAGVVLTFEKMTGGTGGTLKLNGHSTAVGTVRTLVQGSGAIVNGSASANSTLTIDSSAYAARTFSGAIQDGGAASLALKLAGGTLTLSGTASHTGGTEVHGGTLLVGDAQGNGTLDGATYVGPSGTLGGSGTLTGPTEIDGTLSAGNSPGTLTFTDNLTLNGGATSVFEFNTPGVVGGTGLGGNDLVRVGGALNIDGTLKAEVAAAGYYRLFDYGSAAGNFAFADEQVTSSRAGFTVDTHRMLYTDVPNQVNLVVLGAGQGIQFWDGPNSASGGVVSGGSGTWQGGDTNWLNDPTMANAGWGNSVGVFSGAAGTVNVAGVQDFDTLQFSTDGYRVEGDALQMRDVSGGGVFSVDGGVTATVASDIQDGAGNRLIKVGEGKLALEGAKSYTGGTRLLSGLLSVSQDDSLGAATGELSFNGGLLQVTGTNYATTARDITIDARGGGFHIDDAGHTFTLNQNITGAGALYKVGAGTLALNGVNAYGDTRVVEGTLVGNSGSFSGNIANAATVVFQQDNDGSFAGDIAQFGDDDYAAGSMIKQGAGALTLTGTSALDWQVKSGKLSSAASRFGGNAQLDGAASTLSFTDDAHGTYAGVLSGNGVFSMDGAGTVLLTGDSTGFSGRTTVNKGTLLVGEFAGDGALGGSVDVLAGGTLGGSGTVGSGAGAQVRVASGGTLSPGNSIGTLTVNGDLVFDAGSRLTIEVSPESTRSDLVKVTGASTLNGGSVVHVGANGQYNLNSVYTILSSQGGVSGRFDTVSSDFAFLQPHLLYDDGVGTVKLSLARNNTDFRSVALTRNQLATADGIESIGMGAGHAVYDAIAQLPNNLGLIRASLDALSGEIHGSARTALVEESRFVRNAANDRLRAALGASTSSAVSTAMPLKQSTTSKQGQAGVLASAAQAGPVFWSQAFGSWGSTSSDGNAARLQRDTSGVLMGVDTPAGDWRVGVLGGYSHSSFKANERASTGRSDNYHLGVYGGRQWGELALRAGAAYSWHDLKTKRDVAIPGLSDHLRGDYKAGTTQVFAEVGYGVMAGQTRLEPFANLAYVSLRAKGFNEQGGAAALSGDSGTTAATFGTLGLRAEYDFVFGEGRQATVRGLAGWRHGWGDTTPESTHRFSAGQAFTIAGVPIARDSAVLEAGLDVRLTPMAKLGLSYQGQLASGARDHGVKANLAIKF